MHRARDALPAPLTSLRRGWMELPDLSPSGLVVASSPLSTACFNTSVFFKQLPLVDGKTDCNSHAWPLPSCCRVYTNSVLLSFLGRNVRLLDLVL
ncbi:hypothetical protein C4D60_Mb07t10960 [Musa balbisiana]|uniref:Uncharacterized protein n=1 Tax=Musa balbisiana TaxID=52838 RepID=A0A4S8JEN5_MUSBA|nr:hypothetical protein C4D60_Mb07t10960 [Musa balbisiana]